MGGCDILAESESFAMKMGKIVKDDTGEVGVKTLVGGGRQQKLNGEVGGRIPVPPSPPPCLRSG